MEAAIRDPYWHLTTAESMVVASSKSKPDVFMFKMDLMKKEGDVKVQVLPEAPTDLVMELSRRYMLLYEMITDEVFSPAVVQHDQLAADVHTAMHRLAMEKCSAKGQT